MLASSPGGRFLAFALTRGGDRRRPVRHAWVGLWDRELRRELLLRELDSRVRCLAVGPAGRTVAVGRGDGQVEVLRVGVADSYRRFRPGGASGAPQEALGFSPGGEVLVGAATQGEGATVEAWEVETGRLVFSGACPFPVRSLRFLPRGGKTWESTGTPVGSPSSSGSRPGGLASRGEAWFAQGDWSGNHLLWGSSWDLVLEDPTRGWVGYLDGSRIRWLGGPRLRLKARLELGGEEGHLGLRELLPGGREDCLYSSDGSALRSWSTGEGGSRLLVEARPGVHLAGLGFLGGPGQGKLLYGAWGPGASATGHGGSVRALSLSLSREEEPSEGEPLEDGVEGCGPETVVAADGSRVAFFGGDVGSRAPGGTLVVRGLTGGARDWILDPGDSRPGGVVALSPRGRWAATGFYRSRTGSHGAAVFDLGAGKPRYSHSLEGPARLLGFCPEQENLAVALDSSAGEEARGVLVKRLRGRGRAQHFPLPEDPVAMGFHPDGRHLLVSLADRSLWVVDLRLGRILGHVELPRGRASCVGFRASGDHFFTGGEDGSVLLWSSRSLFDRLRVQG